MSTSGSRRHVLTLLGACAVAASLATIAAAASTGFAAQHLPLAPLNGEPLSSGFAEVIHPNGPEIYARHEYALNGADENVSYAVEISIWTSNLTCSGAPLVVIPAAVLVTNSSGNGHASVVHTPEQLAALGVRGLTIGGQVTILRDGTPSYTTGCRVIELD